MAPKKKNRDNRPKITAKGNTPSSADKKILPKVNLSREALGGKPESEKISPPDPSAAAKSTTTRIKLPIEPTPSKAPIVAKRASPVSDSPRPAVDLAQAAKNATARIVIDQENIRKTGTTQRINIGSQGGEQEKTMRIDTGRISLEGGQTGDTMQIKLPGEADQTVQINLPAQEKDQTIQLNVPAQAEQTMEIKLDGGNDQTMQISLPEPEVEKTMRIDVDAMTGGAKSATGDVRNKSGTIRIDPSTVKPSAASETSRVPVAGATGRIKLDTVRITPAASSQIPVASAPAPAAPVPPVAKPVEAPAAATPPPVAKPVERPAAATPPPVAKPVERPAAATPPPVAKPIARPVPPRALEPIQLHQPGYVPPSIADDGGRHLEPIEIHDVPPTPIPVAPTVAAIEDEEPMTTETTNLETPTQPTAPIMASEETLETNDTAVLDVPTDETAPILASEETLEPAAFDPEETVAPPIPAAVKPAPPAAVVPTVEAKSTESASKVVSVKRPVTIKVQRPASSIPPKPPVAAEKPAAPAAAIPKPAPAPAPAAPAPASADIFNASTMAMDEKEIKQAISGTSGRDIFNAATMAMDGEEIKQQIGDEPDSGAPRPKTIMIKRPSSPTAKTIKTLKPPSAADARTVKTTRPTVDDLADVEDGLTSQKKTSTTKIDLPEDVASMTATASHKRTVKIKRPDAERKQVPKTVGVRRASETAGVAPESTGSGMGGGALRPTGTDGTLSVAWPILSVLCFMVAVGAVYILAGTVYPEIPMPNRLIGP